MARVGAVFPGSPGPVVLYKRKPTPGLPWWVDLVPFAWVSLSVRHGLRVLWLVQIPNWTVWDNGIGPLCGSVAKRTVWDSHCIGPRCAIGYRVR